MDKEGKHNPLYQKFYSILGAKKESFVINIIQEKLKSVRRIINDISKLPLVYQKKTLDELIICLAKGIGDISEEM